MCSPTTTINHLPAEMIGELFKYLQPKDLLSCSLVNKRWKSLVFAIGRLTFSGLPSEFNLNRINRFSELVRLKITMFRSSGKKVNLNFPKLRILVLHYFAFPLCIDSPKLSVLVFHGNVNRLTIKHPESIRKLVTDIGHPKLGQFKNVECLVTRSLEAVSKDTLRLFPKLKELHYNRVVDGFMDDVKRTLSDFLDGVTALKGLDFRSIFSGFHLTKKNVTEFDYGLDVDDEWGIMIPEYIFIKNHRMLDPVGTLDFIDHLNYNCLMRNVHGQIPAWFFQKFTGIKCIFVDGPLQDVNQFRLLLKSLCSIKTIVFNSYSTYNFKEFDLPQSSNELFEYLSKLDTNGNK